MIQRLRPAPRRIAVANEGNVSSLRLLAGNSLSLIATQLVTSVLGAAYWWYAARHFSPTAVGVAGAAVSAMLLLGSIANVGLGTLMMGELPRMRSDRTALIAGGLAASALCGTALGVGAGALAQYVSPDLAPVSHDSLRLLVFGVGCGATAAATVLDQALIGLFRGRVQLWRNAFFSVLKLAALFPAAAGAARGSALAIYATWSLGTVVSIAAVIRAVRVSDSGSRPLLAAQWGRLRVLARAALPHFGFNLALQIPAFALPIFAVALLSARDNASFYVAWQVVALLFVVPIALTSVLYPVIARDPAGLARITRLTIITSLAVSAAGILCLALASEQILGVFGHRYAVSGATTLEILALASIPMTIKSHYVAVYRIAGRLARALPLVWGAAILELAAASVGVQIWGSLRSFSASWVVMLSVESLAMIGPVVAATRVADATALTARLSGRRRGD